MGGLALRDPSLWMADVQSDLGLIRPRLNEFSAMLAEIITLRSGFCPGGLVYEIRLCHHLVYACFQDGPARHFDCRLQYLYVFPQPSGLV